MDIFEVSIVNSKTGEVLQNQKFADIVNSNRVQVEGGNIEKFRLPMTFKVSGDFTVYKDYVVGQKVRFKVNGFDEEVELLDVTSDGITIKTSHEVGRKLITVGYKKMVIKDWFHGRN